LTSIPRAALAGESTGLAVEPALRQFPYGAVRLKSSRLLDQYDAQQRLFMRLDEDALLKPFRQLAGQPAPGADMGGWYDSSTDFHIDPNDWSTANWHGFIPGHSFGQYVSGLARGFATTRDERIRRKISSLVEQYGATISPKFFAGYTLPAYTYDKLVVGLLDAFRFANVTVARDLLDRVTDAATPALPPRAITREERRQLPHTSEAQIWDEPYTLPENLFLAAQAGMGARYQPMAQRYLQDAPLFDPLAAGQSPFKGKHAYSHVNALCSAVQAYLVTGNRKYLAAARNGFGFVEAQSYATGGWGPNEELLAPDDTSTLYDMLESTHRTFETPCGAYAHFKITRYLMRLTQDSRYGDSMERVLYNTILGAMPTLDDGRTFYYSDYNHRATKFYRGEPWPCCSGTFVQLAADYAISAYFFDARSVYVNLFVPSQVTAELAGRRVTIAQDTQYPYAAKSRLTVETSRPGEFGIALRIPAWSARTSVNVNGKPHAGGVPSGAFLMLSRKWTSGDTIEIEFDMTPRLVPLDATHQDVVALATGPLVLFPVNPSDQQFTADEWLRAKRGESGWSVSAPRGAIQLKPFMDIEGEAYRLYSRISKA
jgi:DUF1680 family protein